MAIAGDIKLLFDYLFTNNLITEEQVNNLLDIKYCAENFSSGKYPILINYDTTKPHQEQRKYGSDQARYYDPKNFLIRFNGREYFFTSQLFEEQRKHFYKWIMSNFNLNIQEVIKSKKPNLLDVFENFVNSGEFGELLSLEEFYFEKALKIFNEFKEFGSDVGKSFFENALSQFKDAEIPFSEFLPKLKKNSKQYELFDLIGKLIAYLDLNAYNKNLWNETPDKRVLGRSSVRQTDWVKTLLLYKVHLNDLSVIKEGSIKNSLNYLENPIDGLTILSEKHRSQFSLNVLGNQYDPASFSESLKEYFSVFDLNFKNEANRTEYLCYFLYKDEIKPLWLSAVDEKSYWLVGAYWGNREEKERDQTQSFLEKGIWQNGFDENSNDPSLDLVKKIKKGDLIAVKSSFTVNDGNGERIPCLRIKAIGEILDNEKDGVRLKVKWSHHEPFDVPGLSYRKTADKVRDSDVEKIFKRLQNESVEMKELKIKGSNSLKSNGPLNVIYYGPPGTGKTFKLTSEIAERFSVNHVTSDLALISEMFSDMPWWRVFACAMIDLKKPVSVKSIQEHAFVKAKIQASNTENISSSIKPMIWGSLQAKTILESKTVNVKERRAPYVFDKSENSEWFLAGNWKEELSEEIELVRKVRLNNSDRTVVKRFEFVTFHPSYGYEDFVEGIKPVLDNDDDSRVQYALVNGIFKKMCLKASADPENEYAIFIDEINRGNIPSIFGELITLIEEDKRESLFTILPYSKKPFTVPKNLYIYGTMNTADKSVEALDLALRRRFVFEELQPNSNEINCKFSLEVVKKIHETINLRIEALLGKDYRVGHSYFMNNNVNSLDDLKSVFEKKIIPLLKEYFYEDWDKICLVLGKKFVIKINSGRIKFARSYEESDGEFESKNVYRISDSREWTLDTFKSIYED